MALVVDAAWGRELRKGLLDMALLRSLVNEDAHGYALIQSMKDLHLVPAAGSDATVYQALQRLAESGLASAAWTTPGSDERPRKVYTITRRGQEMLRAMTAEWKSVSRTINHLLEEPR
jgi:PadR family transcriptional regulator PadR